MDLEQAESYFLNEIRNLREIAKYENPWVFLCASAYIEYLSKLAFGSIIQREAYTKFIKEYMPEDYTSFTYKSGAKDLPEQMYYILRCGIVHSFSFYPDPRYSGNKGRIRSIIIAHGEQHMSAVSKGSAGDACCLDAYRFIADLEYATNKLFERARLDPALAEKVTDWLRKHPPIAKIFEENE